MSFSYAYLKGLMRGSVASSPVEMPAHLPSRCQTPRKHDDMKFSKEKRKRSACRHEDGTTRMAHKTAPLVFGSLLTPVSAVVLSLRRQMLFSRLCP